MPRERAFQFLLTPFRTGESEEAIPGFQSLLTSNPSWSTTPKRKRSFLSESWLGRGWNSWSPITVWGPDCSRPRIRPSLRSAYFPPTPCPGVAEASFWLSSLVWPEPGHRGKLWSRLMEWLEEVRSTCPTIPRWASLHARLPQARPGWEARRSHTDLHFLQRSFTREPLPGGPWATAEIGEIGVHLPCVSDLQIRAWNGRNVRATPNP